MTMANALVVQVDEIRGEMEKRQETLFAAAAAHIKPERFIEQVARACINSPKLLDCNRPSLFMAAAEAASLGLEIDSVLGHAYLVPFKGKVTLVPGYLGLKELAYRSGRIASIEAAAVYQDDEFDYEMGTDKFLKHKPSDSAYHGVPTHVYAIVKTTTHGTIFTVMSWAQVESHRNKFSKGYSREDSAWQTNPMPMAIKTVVRKTLKLCPLSPELQLLMQREEILEQPLFPSGTEAATEDLEAADALLDPQEFEEELAVARGPADTVTPEEEREWRAAGGF